VLKPIVLASICIFAFVLTSPDAVTATEPEMSRRDRSRALDEHLIAYLSAYEDYTTLHVEMETQLKDGYLSLSRAKRDLLRSSSLGQELYPREIDPLIVVAEEPAETEGEAVTLCYQFCE